MTKQATPSCAEGAMKGDQWRIIHALENFKKPKTRLCKLISQPPHHKNPKTTTAKKQ
jgi:hypothetical protein